jgi:hypothetical protein
LVYQVDHAVAGQDISRGHFAAVDEDAVAEDGDAYILALEGCDLLAAT